MAEEIEMSISLDDIDLPEEEVKKPEEDKKTFKPLGVRLLEAGLISEEQLNLALSEHKRRGIFLGDCLVALKIISADILAKFLGQESDADAVDVHSYAVQPGVLDLVPYALAKKHVFLPLEMDENHIKAAFADTLDVEAIDALEKVSGRQVDVMSAPKSTIMEAIEHNYAQKSSIQETIDEILGHGGVDEADAGEALPMVSLIDQILNMGVNGRATDIHFEAGENFLRVRMRVDGVMLQKVLIPKLLANPVLARIKIISKLKITEKRMPQDGRISFNMGTKVVDMRVSTLPTNYGESAVLRVLDKENLNLNFKSLGYSPKDELTFNKILKNPNGLILVTGPTGSGKTSSLYAALGVVNTPERTVLTLEDPIEYNLAGVRQTSVQADIGMDFAAGLRAMLRQDPDIIMVGEIRDQETAGLAIRAAMTGHLVLSTLHTNSAAGAIPRLTDMGIKPYLVASSLTAIVAQRLVRKICSRCRQKAKSQNLTPVRTLGLKVPDGGITLYDGAGCDFCGNTGYSGRVGIYEVVPIDERFHEMIINGAGTKEIEALAVKIGIRRMVQDAVSKVAQGLTTVEEILKVV